jgi:hypothetical protein
MPTIASAPSTARRDYIAVIDLNGRATTTTTTSTISICTSSTSE